MSEIKVHRSGERVVMMLIDDTNPSVEVTLDEGEASMLASLLLKTVGEPKRLEKKPVRQLMAPADLRAHAHPFQNRRFG